ncbi:MAG: hypothetical protein AAF645_04825 [Myxococcota bacterium]
MQPLRYASLFVLLASALACGGSDSAGQSSSSGGEGCYIETVDGEDGCWADVEEACTFAQCDDCSCTEISGGNTCTCGGGGEVPGGDEPVSNEPMADEPASDDPMAEDLGAGEVPAGEPSEGTLDPAG